MVWDILKFSKKLRKKDYEKELEELQAKITNVETSIKKNQMSEASFSSNWMLYSSLLYLLSSALVYFFSPIEWGPLRFLPLVIGPVIIFLGKRFLKGFFQRKLKSQETFLDFLKTELKSKVEEIKNNEPYNKAKQLLERYETKKEEPMIPSPGSQPIRHRAQPGSPAMKPGMQQGFPPNFQPGMGGPQQQGMPPGVRPGVGPSAQQRPGPPFNQQQQQQMSPTFGYPPNQQRGPPPPVANPTWVDKLVDYAVGDSQAANMNSMLEKVQKENIHLRNALAELQRELKALKTPVSNETQPMSPAEGVDEPVGQEHSSSAEEETPAEESPSDGEDHQEQASPLPEAANNDHKEE